MMVAPVIYKTFKSGSRTYFYSSLFFPEPLKSDVFILYSFVRKADDFVDAIPQQLEEFDAFCNDYEKCLAGEPSQDIIINEFVKLMKRINIQEDWIDAFLKAMRMDTTKNTYNSIDETKEYMYGSAEVIGLCMSRIFNLPEESLPFAQMQGRAMQYINFIRDIAEDNSFGRQYLPLNIGTSLTSLRQDEVSSNTKEFKAYIRKQIELYQEWQDEAEKGYKFIKKRYLIPIKTASDMYKWTSEKIYNDPMLVFDRKVKPGKMKILSTIIKNALTI